MGMRPLRLLLVLVCYYACTNAREADRAPPPRLLAVVGVISAREHVQRRDTIRATWAAPSQTTSPQGGDRFAVAYVIGCAPNASASTTRGCGAEGAHFDASSGVLTVPVVDSYARVFAKLVEFVTFASARWEFDFLLKVRPSSGKDLAS